jgi:hypothetical protein
MQCEQTALGLEHHTGTQDENHTLVEFERDEKGSTSFGQKYRSSILSLPSSDVNFIAQ